MTLFFRLAASILLGVALSACATPETGPHVATRTSQGELAPAQLHEDFRALYDGLQRAHFDLYANRPKSEFDRLFADTLTGLDHPMSRTEAQIRFQLFVAEGRVAHARIDPPMDAFGEFFGSGGRIFPFGVRLREGRVFVAENLSGLSDIRPGDEIVAINGQATEQWVRRLRRHISADSDYLADAILEPQFTVLMWFELGPVDTFQVALQTRDGRRLDLSVPARTRAEISATPEQGDVGLVLDPTVRDARMMPEGVAYLRPGVFMNTVEGEDPFDATAFHAFIDRAFEGFLAQGATTLLIDLRDNPGGDNSFSDHMVAWFADRPFLFSSDFRVRVSREAIAANAARLGNAPDGISRQYAEAYALASEGEIIDFPIPMTPPRAGDRFTGPVFVLVNRRSFSNAVSVAAIVQDNGFGRILGEPTADLATTYGAMETFVLPNSGIVVGFPKAHIIRPNGDERVQGVTPDDLISTPILEPADDPVLRQALARLDELDRAGEPRPR